MANSEPVVLASNQSAIPITDNSGSVTVDFNDAIVGTPASAIPAKGIMVQGSDGTNARDFATTTAGVLKVDISATAVNTTAIKVDPSGVTQPVSGTFWQTTQPVSGTFWQATQPVSGTFWQATQPVSISGNQAINVAQISGSTVATAATGVQKVGIVGNSGATLDAVVGAGTAPTNMQAVGGIYNSTEISPTTGQSAALQLDSKGRQRMVLMDAAGNTRGVNIDASNRLSVTLDNVSATNISTNIAQMNGVATTMGNGTSGTGVQRVTIASDSTGNIATIGTSITPGTSAANLGKAEDAAHASGDTGVMMLGVRQSTTTDLSAGSTDGDYEPFQVGKNGGVKVAITAEAQGGLSVATGSIGATKTDIGTANTAGGVFGWYIFNVNTSAVYVQFFNTQASGVTLGTTAPVYSLGIPAGAGANVLNASAIQHSTAISIAITTTRAGATGPSSTVDYNIFYKQ